MFNIESVEFRRPRPFLTRERGNIGASSTEKDTSMTTSTRTEWGAIRSNSCTESSPNVHTQMISCPQCNGEKFDNIVSGQDFLTNIGGRFNVLQCCDCGLVITNPRPTSESLGHFYPVGYSPYKPSEPRTRRSQWFERLALRSEYGYQPRITNPFEMALAKLAKWRFHSPKQRHEWIPFRAPGRLLDVGCGGGRFLEKMQYFGWKVTGIEYAADIAREVEHKTGIKVHVGTLPHPDLQSQSFDAVTIWHVLEHVPNPAQFARVAVNLLRPGGLLVIEVPNIASDSFEEFGEHWAHLELPRHFQHFSPETLSSILPNDLVKIVDIQQIGWWSMDRRSAERAVAAGRLEYREWLNRGKSFWKNRARKSELTNRADVIRLIAERTT